mgnify:CR=1 FL=1
MPHTADSTSTESSTVETAAQATTEVTTPDTPVSESGLDWFGSLDKALDGLNNPEKTEEADQVEESTKTETPEVEYKSEEGGQDEGAEEEVTTSMTRSAGAKFKELKSELKDWKAKYAELEKVLEEAGSKPPEDYEALKAKVAEYEQELSVTRVEATEQYKQSVVVPLNTVLTSAYALADKYGVEEATLQAALSEKDIDKQSEMLQDLASAFTERDRLGLYRMADDVAILLKRRDEIKANAQSAYSTLTEKQKREASEARTQALNSVYSTLSEKIPLLKNKDIASKVKSIVESTDVASAKPDVQAYAAYAGALLPHIFKEYQSQASKIAELEKTIASFRKTVPKAGGGKQTAVAAMPADVGFLEALESHL